MASRSSWTGLPRSGWTGLPRSGWTGLPRSGWTGLVLAAALTGALASVHAQEVRLLVQSSPLAGYRYHEAPRLFGELRVGHRLELVREPDNPHDVNAVRVEWRGRMLGYVPRRENAALAWALDRGDALAARVSALGARRSRRIEFEVFIE